MFSEKWKVREFTSPLSISGGSGALLSTIDLSILKASSTQDGYLSNTDWIDFDQKLDSVSTVSGESG